MLDWTTDFVLDDYRPKKPQPLGPNSLNSESDSPLYAPENSDAPIGERLPRTLALPNGAAGSLRAGDGKLDLPVRLLAPGVGRRALVNQTCGRKFSLSRFPFLLNGRKAASFSEEPVLPLGPAENCRYNRDNRFKEATFSRWMPSQSRRTRNSGRPHMIALHHGQGQGGRYSKIENSASVGQRGDTSRQKLMTDKPIHAGSDHKIPEQAYASTTQREMGLRNSLAVCCCLLLVGGGLVHGAPQKPATSSSSTTEATGNAEEVYGCMCVPKDECKDDTVDSKDKPPEVPGGGSCGPEQVCCFHLIVRTEKTVETHSYIFPQPEVQTALAQKGEFPWQAMLFSTEEEFLCSGVIVGPKTVLSTADCVHKFQGDKASKLFVRLGVLDRSVLENSPIHQNYTVDKVIVHPKFRSAQIRNVAVIKLREEVATTPTIGRIVLAEPKEGSFVGSQCVISGWGKNLKRMCSFSHLDGIGSQPLAVLIISRDFFPFSLREGHRIRLFSGCTMNDAGENTQAAVAVP
ncbi:hypothetical protein HPB48_007772 [Haemaphysalis longicornis]|uniref:Peptidase S1 domain-containing protein n=1 Tax=Haemaphysalis longicornis TaxID=44386 RepID=A0A9J6FS13_HAELO|nr:hypothetical protein HPB48_007772 [Haemaphysalis longicornis]